MTMTVDEDEADVGSDPFDADTKMGYGTDKTPSQPTQMSGEKIRSRWLWR